MKYLFTIALSLVFTMSYAQDIPGLPQENLKKMEISKTPCFGQCPQYTLTVYKNKVAVFHGKSYVDKKGIFMKELDKKQYKALKKAYRKGKFCKMEKDQLRDVQDAAQTILRYYKRRKTVTVKTNIAKTEDFEKIESIFESIRQSDGWTTIKEEKEKTLPSNVISNQIYIQLVQDADMNKWLRNYKQYAMQIDRSMVPNFNFFKVIYSLNKIDAEEMIKLLKNDDQVQSFKFEKKKPGSANQ